MQDRIFDQADADVMALALEQQPDLEAAAYVAKQARSRSVKYPIGDVQALGEIAEGGELKIRNISVTLKDAEHFVPKDFFPIESEEDLIRKVLVAFLIGRGSHAAERGVKSTGGVGDVMKSGE